MGFNKEALVLRDADWLRHHFIDKAMSILDIASLIGCKRRAVDMWLDRHGIKARKPKHYMRHTKGYQCWIDMIRRCNNRNRESYPSYGGRGIRVCDRWLSFENFYQDMGDAPQGMTIERNDVNGNYEPSNCRWATVKEQSLNTTRSRFVTVDGERMNVTTAAERYGITKTAIRMRLLKGWSDEDAVKTPSRTKNRPGPRK